MALSEKLGGFFEKREKVQELSDLERRIGVAPKLVHEVLVQNPAINSYTLENIRGNPVRERLFKKLLSSLYDSTTPGRSEQLFDAIRTNAIGPAEQRDIFNAIEEYKARCALTETVTGNLDAKMLKHVARVSPDMQSAIGGLAESDALKDAVKDYVWDNAMGDAAGLQKVRAMALHLDAIRAATERPERKEAQEKLGKMLAKKKLGLTEFQNMLDPNDPDGSVKRIGTLIESKNYASGWRRIFKWTGAGRREADRLRAFALDTAAGGLATAEVEIERSMRDMGDALALSVIPDPAIQETLLKAALGEGDNEPASFDFVERAKIKLDSAKRLNEIAQHMERRWFWNEYKSFVKEKVKREGGKVLADPTLTDDESLEYADAFVQKFREQLDALYKKSSILGPVLKQKIETKLQTFETELLAPPNPGKVPPDLA